MIGANQLQPLSLTADGAAAGQRKMQSTQGAKPRNSKRNRNTTNQHNNNMLMVPDHVMEDDMIVPQALDMGSVALGEAGSNYVIADLTAANHHPHAPAPAGGNFSSVTIKKSG